MGFKAHEIHLRIKAIGEGAHPVAVHEMTFHLSVPESVQIDPRCDDFVINVVGGETRVRLVGEECRYRASRRSANRVAGVVGTQRQSFVDPVSARDVPATYIDCGLEKGGVDDYVVQIAPIFGIDLQSSPDILAVELVGPDCLRIRRVRKGLGADCRVSKRPFAGSMFVPARRPNEQSTQRSTPAQIAAIL